MDSRNNPNHKPLARNQQGDRLLVQKAENKKRQEQERARYLASRARIKADIARIHAEFDIKQAIEQAAREAQHAAALEQIEARRSAVPTREQLIDQGLLNSSFPAEDKLRVAGLSIDDNKRLTRAQDEVLGEEGHLYPNELSDLELIALNAR